MLKANKTKAVLLLLLVCVLSLVICACNKPSGTSEESKSSSNNSTTQSVTSSTETTSKEDEPTSSAHSHVYEEISVVDATCTEAGTKTLKCSCGDTKEEPIPAKGHTWDAGEVTSEPTCDTVGTKTFSCTVANCNGSKTEDVPSTGHTWDEGVQTADPDCATGTAGNKHFTCQNPNCQESKDEAIPAKHEYGADNICTGCGAEKTASVLDISALTVGNISAELKVDDVFTIIPGDKALTVEATDKTAEDGTVFTARIKTGGASDLGKLRRLIKLSLTSAGTVKVYAVSGSSSATDATTRTVDFFGVTGKIESSPYLDTAVCKAYEFEVSKAGTYYVGANAGISIYQVEFNPSASSGGAVTVAPFTLSATDITLSAPDVEDQISSNYKINDSVTLLATTNGIFKVKAGTKSSTDGKTFSQRITFNTTGKISEGKCVMQVYIPAAGSITIYCKSSSKTEQRALCVTDGASFTQNIVAEKDYDPANVATSGPELVSPQTVTVPAAGDYFIYSTAGGVYFYELNYVPQA